MPSETTNLLSFQRQFLAALREPVFGGSRDLTSLPPRAGQVSKEFCALAENRIVATPNLPAQERLELYHRQYWFRLLDSIAEDFPALQRLLGLEQFWRLMEAYLETVPSRSYTLRHLGAGLAEFLKLNPGLVGDQPTHAMELAQLEYGLCEIFEQPKLPAVAPDSLTTATLALQPHLRLFAFRTPVDAIWRLDDDAVIPARLLARPLGAAQFHVAVFRHRARQVVLRIEAGEFALLQGLAGIGSLVAALDVTPATPDEVRMWFQRWTELGWLCVDRPHLKIEIQESSSDCKPITIPLQHQS